MCVCVCVCVCVILKIVPQRDLYLFFFTPTRVLVSFLCLQRGIMIARDVTFDLYSGDHFDSVVVLFEIFWYIFVSACVGSLFLFIFFPFTRV